MSNNLGGICVKSVSKPDMAIIFVNASHTKMIRMLTSIFLLRSSKSSCNRKPQTCTEITMIKAMAKTSAIKREET